MKEQENNKVTLSGEVVEESKFSHYSFGEKVYECKIRVLRLSNTYDILPVLMTEELVNNGAIVVGETISITGQFRSYNKIVNEKSKLVLSVAAKQILQETPKQPNEIVLSGYICKPPVYRTTPLNREIGDLLIAVNREFRKTDYIPCIAWGRNARFVKDLQVGERITIKGRIQSREYQKRISETETKTMTAYEVSISNLSVGEV